MIVKSLILKFKVMNINLLDKLKRSGDLSVSVKPIFKNDNNEILLKNFLNKQKFLNSNEIFEILKINFDEDQPIGYILMKDKDVVGFLGTIFSRRPIKEKIIDHCYLHSWVVFERYRLAAFKLILPIIKKNIFISTYSPIKSLMGLYKKLGFEEAQFYSKFVPSFFFLKWKTNGLNCSDDISFFEKFLSNKDRIVLKDHNFTDTKKIFIYFNKNTHDNVFIIVKKKTKKLVIPILELIYISDFKKFKSYEKKIGFELLKKYKPILFKFNSIDNSDAFLSKSFFTKIVKKNVYYLNRPLDFKFDILYSELV